MDNRINGWLLAFSAFSALSCGDAVPPPGEAAVAISIASSPAGTFGTSCKAHSLVWASNDVGPNVTSPGELLVDGRNGAGVTCSVAGGGSYRISGSVDYGGARFSVIGSVNTDGTGTASVDFYDPVLYNGLTDPSCTVTASGGSYKVESGAIWANVKCLNLRSSGDAYTWCSGDATVVLKSCSE